MSDGNRNSKESKHKHREARGKKRTDKSETEASKPKPENVASFAMLFATITVFAATLALMAPFGLRDVVPIDLRIMVAWMLLAVAIAEFIWGVCSYRIGLRQRR